MALEDDPRAFGGCIAILIIGIALIVDQAKPMYNSFNQYLEKSEIMYKTAQVEIMEDKSLIKASPKLSGFFPIRAYDFNKDGLIDKVERLYHGGGRIPYAEWKSFDINDPEFIALQKEYLEILVLNKK